MYIHIWEFHAKPGCEHEFEHANGSGGEWAKLFNSGEGYLGTELIRDATNSRRYLTIDRWTSQAAYENFRAQWRQEYETIDKQCETLTVYEKAIGAFSLVK